jgi:hypothetical protein
MKKINLFYLLILLAIVLIAFSCNKNDVISSSGLLSNNESNDDPKSNEFTWVTSGENHSKFLYGKIQISVGHNASDCGNKCVKILGEQGHVDCRGYGNVCSRIVDVQFAYNNGVSLILVDTAAFGDDLDYLIPDRTLFISNPQNNTDFWLNIPEQLLVRNSTGVPFVIYDVWFSEEPELENK